MGQILDPDAIFYLDYAKPFDKADRRLLIDKLQKYGFNGKVLTWLDSFLISVRPLSV